MKSVLASIKITVLVWVACMLCQLAEAQTSPGNALHFNGSNYVIATLATSPTIAWPVTTYTVEAWVKPEVTDEGGTFLSISKPTASRFDPFTLLVGGPDLIIYYSFTRPNRTEAIGFIILPNFGISLNHWNHIAVVYTGPEKLSISPL